MEIKKKLTVKVLLQSELTELLNFFPQVVPDTWSLIPWVHRVFIAFNVFMWISLYYANMREPGFIPCNSPEYDMALKQVS